MTKNTSIPMPSQMNNSHKERYYVACLYAQRKYESRHSTQIENFYDLRVCAIYMPHKWRKHKRLFTAKESERKRSCLLTYSMNKTKPID